MKTLSALLIFTLCFISAANAQGFRLVMRQLLCNKTTESGEDEVYIIVAGKTSNGSYWNFRMPGPNNHWDLNDGNSPRDVTDWELAASALPLNVGESAALNIYIMEEDGGSLGQILDVAKKVIDQCPDPRCLAASNVIQTANSVGLPTDTDDYIGSFSVVIYRTPSGYSCEWMNLTRCGKVGWSNGGGCEEQINFSGDGSAYVGTFRLDLR